MRLFVLAVRLFVLAVWLACSVHKTASKVTGDWLIPLPNMKKRTYIELTISTHSDGHALLEPAILAAVPVDAQDRAVLVLRAWLVLNLLLDRTAEKALRNKQEQGQVRSGHDCYSGQESDVQAAVFKLHNVTKSQTMSAYYLIILSQPVTESHGSSQRAHAMS